MTTPIDICFRLLGNSVKTHVPISGTSGSSGLGSVSREQIDNKTLLIVSAGDHCDLKINNIIYDVVLNSRFMI